MFCDARAFIGKSYNRLAFFPNGRKKSLGYNSGSDQPDITRKHKYNSMTAEFILTIFHTNDMHGSLEAMARLSSLSKRLRAEARLAGQTVFYFDAGDAADRKLAIVSNSKGAVFGPILNAMGCDLQSLGNDLSLTYGPQCLPAYSERLSFPLLAANLNDADGRLHPGVKESAILPLPGGLQLGVIGLTPRAADTYALFGLETPDPVTVAREAAGRLQEAGADILVLLSHSGIREDREFAAEIPGLELIIGGHSHTTLEHGEMVNDVLIAQAGEYARFLGWVELVIDSASGRVTHKSASLIPVPEDEKPDQAVLDAIAAAELEVNSLRARQVAFLADPLDLDYFEECAFGDYTADLIRERMGAEVAILTSGLFSGSLPSGPITLGQLTDACFTTANPAVTAISGAQILEALEIGRSPEYFKFEFKALRGAPMGIPQVSGLKAWYSPDPKDGRRIQRVEVNGMALDLDRMYQVAHSDVETYEYGCIRLKEGQQTRFEMPTIINEVILDTFQVTGTVSSPTGKRWIQVK